MCCFVPDDLLQFRVANVVQKAFWQEDDRMEKPDRDWRTYLTRTAHSNLAAARQVLHPCIDLFHARRVERLTPAFELEQKTATINQTQEQPSGPTKPHECSRCHPESRSEA